MSAFGNLVYVPFLYSLQGLYLVRHKVALPYYILAVITFLNGELLSQLYLDPNVMVSEDFSLNFLNESLPVY